MNGSNGSATISGAAFRVTIMAAQQAEAYERVHVQIDSANAVVHIFGPDAQTHYLTVPIGCTLIEWRDPSVLEPRPRMPPYGPGAFQQMGDELQRMTEEMGRTFGQP